MTHLEDLRPEASIRGIVPDAVVTVVSVKWYGSEAVEVTYKTPEGKVANELVYREAEPQFEVVEQGRPWSFEGDGGHFRLVSEANRIRLAHLFDPVLAVHTSLVEPLPHQITAVYEEMLPRQPLRFLLADDPGAGKTIMAGLLIKELIARGDLQRCLVVCPGSLADQWQDELYRRFQLPFEILTNDKLEAARTGNWFLETDLAIARLDKLSRNEDVQEKLQAPDCRWDLVVCDEAHKMSATSFGSEIKYTKRHQLGRLLSPLTRHFLLMTATPHNGKEEDFQLFMSLLDGDRFEGRFRDGVHVVDVDDLMRRMVKENLVKFDGTPLFPERIAYTVPYKLSDPEARLYAGVTEYVREEFNRAEALQNDKRAGTVGFALTILQRRLASSPEAIYQSLRRRRERLESRLRELEILQRSATVQQDLFGSAPLFGPDDFEDLEEAPEDEVAAAEEEILDQATAARTITELKSEIATLKSLESLASTLRRSGTDTKWRELAALLGEIFTPVGLAGEIGEVELRHGCEPGSADPRGDGASGCAPPPAAYIESFFKEAFYQLGGTVREREPRRFEIRHVPAAVRSRDRLIGTGEPVLSRYERIAFEKSLVAPQGKALAAFVCPGHSLLDATIDLTLERHRDLLRRGAGLVDERDAGTTPRVLFYLEHALQDASRTRNGDRRVVSKQMLYVELGPDGASRHLHYAPYLDYRPLKDDEPEPEDILAHPACDWIDRSLEEKAVGHAIAEVVPGHLAEVRVPRLELIEKTRAAVKDRLTKEIIYWDHRAQELKHQEEAGKSNVRLNSAEARKRADNLQARLQKRLEELDQEAKISPLPPVALGGVLVVPAGLIAEMTGREQAQSSHPTNTQESAARARAIVMEVERALGSPPRDREFEQLGYDIESQIPGTGRLRFLEVKGRVADADTVTVTRNEILYSLNKPEDFILALIEWLDDGGSRVRYLRQPFQREPDFGVTSVNYDFRELVARAEAPS